MSKDKKAASTDSALGAEQVQAATDAAEDKGYYGVSPDPTPRENYTVAGQVKAAATPETDPQAAADADAAAKDLEAGALEPAPKPE